MDIGIHNVTRIELARSYPANSNSRMIRIVSVDWNGHETKTEITVYGDTDALDALPKAKDYRVIDKTQEAA